MPTSPFPTGNLISFGLTRSPPEPYHACQRCYATLSSKLHTAALGKAALLVPLTDGITHPPRRSSCPSISTLGGYSSSVACARAATPPRFAAAEDKCGPPPFPSCWTARAESLQRPDSAGSRLGIMNADPVRGVETAVADRYLR